MDQWLKISLLLCLFGFLKEIRPSEPFIYDFLIGPWRNVTGQEVEEEVYPVGIYANLILLVPVFLITDMCRYKPLIVVLGLSGIACWGMLIWSKTLFELQVLEVFYGMFCAAEVAYYTYIYAKVDSLQYQKVTSHTRGAILAGRAISGISSQILVSTNTMDYMQLNYISFASVSIATLWALFLPRVERSLYFHSNDNINQPLTKKMGGAFRLMKSHFLDAYTSLHVVKWSAWWALSTCGYVQIESYMQPLYAAIQNNNQAAYNGAVEAILTLSGAAVALLAGYLRFNWEIKGELTLGIFSLIQGALIVVCSQTGSIYLCYAFYIVFGVLYHFMVTIASAQIARFIDQDSYGLIFGINTFVSLVFNSILTSVVATKGSGFALDARGQYVVYGGYHLVISVVFIVMGMRTCWVGRNGVRESTDNIVGDDEQPT